MPGRCPSCNQTYVDEALTFCPNDGTPLVRETPPPAYDPQAGMYGAQPPGGYPPPPPQQQGYYPGAPQQPGGQAPPPPGWQPPYGQQQYGGPQYGAPAAGARNNKMPLIIAALALVLIGGGIGLYFLLRDNSSSTTSTTTNTSSTPTSSPAATRSPGGTTTTTFPTPSTTTTTTTTTARDYTEDEKHRLFQAVGMTGDNALIVEVAQKIGLFDSKGQPNENFQPFLTEHIEWGKKNFAWAAEYRDPQKARAYVMANK